MIESYKVGSIASVVFHIHDGFLGGKHSRVRIHSPLS